MPDFDKDLNPIIKREAPAQLNDIVLAPKTYSAPSDSLSNYQGKENIYDLLAQDSKSADFTPKGIFVTNAQLEANSRYRVFNPTVDNNEDYFAYGQSVADKAANGILKGLNLAATTVAGGFGMLYGIQKLTKSISLTIIQMLKRTQHGILKITGSKLTSYMTSL